MKNANAVLSFRFDLPGEQDEYLLRIHGPQFQAVSHDTDQWLRAKIKYSDKSEQYLSACEDVRDLIRELFNDYDIPLGLL